MACVDVCRPADLGFDVVLESATKYMGGHSDLIAGVYAGSRTNVQKVSKTLLSQLNSIIFWMSYPVFGRVQGGRTKL